MRTTFTMLVHGEAGVGKSRFIDTMPAPRLILDAEGRAHYLPSGPKVFWDPRTQAPPAPPTAEAYWETCVAVVPDFETLDIVYRHLQGPHPFKSVGLDSLMEVQKRLIDDVAGLDQLDQRDWGVVLRKLEKLVRDYRDLVMRPENPCDVVIMSVGSRDQDGKMRPMLQGQMSDTIPFYMDAVGYMYTTHSPEGLTRAMLVQPTPTAVAKDGTDRLGGPSIPNPNMAEIYATLSAAFGGEPAVPSLLPAKE